MIIIVFNTQSVTICGLKRIDELSSDSWRDLLKIATQVLLSSKLEIVMDQVTSQSVQATMDSLIAEARSCRLACIVKAHKHQDYSWQARDQGWPISGFQLGLGPDPSLRTRSGGCTWTQTQQVFRVLLLVPNHSLRQELRAQVQIGFKVFRFEAPKSQCGIKLHLESIE